MNKKDWYKALSLADDKFISEAQPGKKVKPRIFKIIGSAVAACLSLAVIACSLWLFIPFNDSPSVLEYSDSEYYELIKKLNVLTSEKPIYKNNAERLLAEIELRGQDITEEFWDAEDDFLVDEDFYEDAEAPQAGVGSSYEEITDNQVEGIIEADRIKRSDKYIYYLDENTLRVYSIDKEKTKEVGNYPLYVSNVVDGWVSYSQWEFYLSSDCKTVTIVTECTKEISGKVTPFVNLVQLDVTNPKDIIKKKELNISGRYMSSRMTNDSILLLTNYYVYKKEINFDNAATFVPQIDEGKGLQCIPSNDIIAPKTLDNINYTIVVKLDSNTLNLQGTAAYLSYSEELYVSKNNIFLTHRFYDVKKNIDGTSTETDMTEIAALSYCGEGLERKGSVTVKGYVKDQWSMDEYEGVLRVFTTTNVSTISRVMTSDGLEIDEDFAIRNNITTNASLYCIDLSDFKVVASVVDFAPPGERVQSVRFDKTTAYVCTSIQLSDPVFFFDLSDLKNITYKDTGTIEGFSSSLINLGDGYLCGIGRGDRWDKFKVEVYEETKDGVRSVCSYELESTYYSTDYKSYYIDRKNQFIGLGVYNKNYSSAEASRYILLQFKENKLIELIDVPLQGDNESMRGVYIDGYMYMFGENDFKVEKVFK